MKGRAVGVSASCRRVTVSPSTRHWKTLLSKHPDKCYLLNGESAEQKKHKSVLPLFFSFLFLSFLLTLSLFWLHRMFYDRDWLGFLIRISSDNDLPFFYDFFSCFLLFPAITFCHGYSKSIVWTINLSSSFFSGRTNVTKQTKKHESEFDRTWSDFEVSFVAAISL